MFCLDAKPHRDPSRFFRRERIQKSHHSVALRLCLICRRGAQQPLMLHLSRQSSGTSRECAHQFFRRESRFGGGSEWKKQQRQCSQSDHFLSFVQRFPLINSAL